MKKKLLLGLLLGLAFTFLTGCGSKVVKTEIQAEDDSTTTEQTSDTYQKKDENNDSVVETATPLIACIVRGEESYIINDTTILNITKEDAGVEVDESGHLVIPETVTWEGKEYTVTSIGNSCFRGNTEIVTVTMPDTIERIQEKAFMECSNLSSITLSKGLTYIDIYAFGVCESLKNIDFPDELSTIKDSAFSSCTALESIDLSNTKVEKIYDSAFLNCTNLKTCILSDTTYEIDRFAFYDCIALTELKLPETIWTIGESALGYDEDDFPSGFENCTFYVTAGSYAEEYVTEQCMKQVVVE